MTHCFKATQSEAVKNTEGSIYWLLESPVVNISIAYRSMKGYKVAIHTKSARVKCIPNSDIDGFSAGFIIKGRLM